MPLEVACAIIEHKSRILVVQRSPFMREPLLWEFPGGKLEPGESARDCIKREIKEELGISIHPEKQLPGRQYASIQLIPFICSWQEGVLKLHEHQDARWLKPEGLRRLNWCPADITVVEDYLKHFHKN